MEVKSDILSFRVLHNSMNEVKIACKEDRRKNIYAECIEGSTSQINIQFSSCLVEPYIYASILITNICVMCQASNLFQLEAV